ncbi:hypothetical protein HY230_03130 [Candidatus Acetothermia bacterium]|nr:hypothetical protein [Candidatus Acetothermia bacterium]
MQFSFKQFRKLGIASLLSAFMAIVVLVVAPVFADNITGTNANETLTGTANEDTINGLGGKDIINGLEGNDTIDGGSGNDTINGGPGLDNITGGSGNDTILGGPDPDEIDGGTGNDNISGGDGNDDITGGLGNDTIRGGPGADTFNHSLNDGNDTYIIVAGDVPNGSNEDYVCGGGHDKIILYDIPKENVQPNPNVPGQLKVTDPDTGGVYNILTTGPEACEKIVHSFLVLQGLSVDSLPTLAHAALDEDLMEAPTTPATWEIQVFDLNASKLLEQQEMPINTPVALGKFLNEVSVSLANGVYLYVVRTRGRHGELTHLEVHKLIVLRK